VESVDVEGGWHHLFADPAAATTATMSPASLPPPAAHLLARAQWVFSFVAAADSTWARNVARIAPEARVVTLSQAPPPTFPGHLTDYLVEQLTPWPAWQQGVTQILGSIAQRGIAPRRLVAGAGSSPETAGRPDAPGERIILHPGSGSPHKCWPAASYLELARRLTQSGHKPRVVIGEVELEQWPAGQADAFAAAAELDRPQTLVELWESYAGATRFVGNDSGPGHLAAITAVSTLALFGPTDPARWRPLGPNVTVLRHQPMEDLAVEKVAEKLLVASA
jgi:hypothetical protein